MTKLSQNTSCLKPLFHSTSHFPPFFLSFSIFSIMLGPKLHLHFPTCPLFYNYYTHHISSNIFQQCDNRLNPNLQHYFIKSLTHIVVNYFTLHYITKICSTLTFNCPTSKQFFNNSFFFNEILHVLQMVLHLENTCRPSNISKIKLQFFPRYFIPHLAYMCLAHILYSIRGKSFLTTCVRPYK